MDFGDDESSDELFLDSDPKRAKVNASEEGADGRAGEAPPPPEPPAGGQPRRARPTAEKELIAKTKPSKKYSQQCRGFRLQIMDDLPDSEQ